MISSSESVNERELRAQISISGTQIAMPVEEMMRDKLFRRRSREAQTGRRDTSYAMLGTLK
jgi:hypothetical protein